ncbi:MAG TPA: PLDc N-terminal domain-containing protein [Humibacter sp.]|nr:PLDc N-terminal domain-containing protein [Marmoricola sp.]HWU47796.1 PLDc N-terminal domain-containing protein [Humibacter sp.]
MEPTVVVVVGIVGLLYVGALAYAIAQIARTPSLNRLEKWVWSAVVVIFPLIGSIAWLVGGPHPFGLGLGDQSRLPASSSDRF